ncbi:MAG: class D sortase [Candidatus Saccharimonadales bacterium]
MDDSPKKPNDQFDASLPLPDEPGNSSAQPDFAPSVSNPAADLIRRKVEAAYQDEPSATTESKDLARLGSELNRSRHQQFIYELTSSGQPLHEIQVAWHDYYAALPDNQKHAVWQEFYSTHAQAAKHSAVAPSMSPESPRPSVTGPRAAARKPQASSTLGELKDSLINNLPGRQALRARPHLQSLAFGLGVGTIVLFIFLFSFFNERIIAPFIQPSRNITNTPIISDGGVIGSNPKIIIPKINVEIPVVYDLQTAEDRAIQNALEDGVVHYAGTAAPGQDGNSVIVGHSSNNLLNRGKYKFAFVLLSRLENGDTFYLQKDGTRYTYQVYRKSIVKPTDVSVLGNTDKSATATLITCDPPGTSANRLVVVGEQISPNPVANTARVDQQAIVSQAASVPGEAPTLWARITRLLAR